MVSKKGTIEVTGDKGTVEVTRAQANPAQRYMGHIGQGVAVVEGWAEWDEGQHIVQTWEATGWYAVYWRATTGNELPITQEPLVGWALFVDVIGGDAWQGVAGLVADAEGQVERANGISVRPNFLRYAHESHIKNEPMRLAMLKQARAAAEQARVR